MKENRKDFIKILDDLCWIYKDYISENKNSKLDVFIGNNIIEMYLYNGRLVVDEFRLLFEHKERDKYKYVSIVLMKLLFGSRIVYSKDNVFFNDKDDFIFRIVVNDEDLFNRMFGMVCIYRDIDFYDKIDNGRRVRNKINRNKEVNWLDERVNISKKLLRTRSMK